MTTKSTKRPKIRMAKRRTPFATIEEAVAAIRAGQMVIVVDDEDRYVGTLNTNTLLRAKVI